MQRTATIERYHVYGTPNYCLALWYRGQELTPRERNALGGTISALQEWIPDDAAGLEKLKALARKQGFTHTRIAGDWDKRTKPKGGKL